VKYSGLFLAMAAIAGYGIAVSESTTAKAAMAWIGASFMIVAAAYALAQPGLLFKRIDGKRPWWAWMLLWPYYVLVWVSLLVFRQVDRRPASTEIVPGVWLSRRLSGSEAESSGVGWKSVLDLAGEFPRTAMLNAAYFSLPVLDGTPPTTHQFRAGVSWIMERRANGPVLIHCALGHGRSASMVIAWLIMAGEEQTVQRAVERVRRSRPGVGLKPSQKIQLEKFLAIGMGEPSQEHAKQ
jgi:Dual specificity phosphatase, catalytic domain